MKKTYEPTPQVPQELLERYRAILAVLSGETTVSQAARSLGLSRNHFQSLMHRGLSGLIEGIGKKPPGRRGKPEDQKEAAEETRRLQKDNERLRHRVETTDRLLLVASDLLKGRLQLRSRSKRSNRKAEDRSGEDKDEGERACLTEAREVRRLGVPAPVAAAAIGVSAATLRRWGLRERRGEAIRRRRGARSRKPLSLETRLEIERHVRDLRGLPGAASLAKTTGASRRSVLSVKKQVLTVMEEERRRECFRVEILRAGVLRGFDQLYVPTWEGMRCLLVSSDGKIPYRTSASAPERYDERGVLAALEKDFDAAGVPLIERADRWRAHEAPRVRQMLERCGVLLLHGPAYYPRYYGQLERQNREHRAWFDSLGPLPARRLPQEADRMVASLNSLWRRRMLAWHTPEEAWKMETPPVLDRQSLREEVHDRAARLAPHLDGKPDAQNLATRLAIEQALTHRGLLSCQKGGWC
jgi:hypothetical protein